VPPRECLGLGSQAREETEGRLAHDGYGLSASQIGVRWDCRHLGSHGFFKFKYCVQHSLPKNRQRLVRREQGNIELWDGSRHDDGPFVGRPGNFQRKDRADVPGSEREKIRERTLAGLARAHGSKAASVAVQELMTMQSWWPACNG
jgi:hypothetical protein